jgi:hypothetical protein
MADVDEMEEAVVMEAVETLIIISSLSYRVVFLSLGT